MWRPIPYFLVRYVGNLVRFVYALLSGARSFLGRTRILLATSQWEADLGSVSERLPNGRLFRNVRTDGCIFVESILPFSVFTEFSFLVKGYWLRLWKIKFSHYLSARRAGHASPAVVSFLPQEVPRASRWP